MTDTLRMRRPAGVRWARSYSGYVLTTVLLALAVVPLLGSQTITLEMTGILIFILFASSLNLVVGGAGMISMGHAAFFAIGGYAAGYLSKELGYDMLTALAVGIGAASVLALLIGLLCVRLSHAYFIMLTLAFGQLVYIVIWKWRGLTGGDDGFVGISPPDVLLATPMYYWFTYAVVVVSLLALWKLGRSPMGAIVAATRDNPDRSSAIGIHLFKYRLVTFIISGAFCGLAGALQAFFSRGMFADSAHFMFSTSALVAILIGGSGVFGGPIVGGFIFIAFRSIVGHFTPYWPLLLGIVICLIAIARPDGLLGHRSAPSDKGGSK